MKFITSIALFFLCFCSGSLYCQDQTESLSQEQVLGIVKTFLQTIDDRLFLMEDVAKWKWNNDAAIEDKPREEIILNNIVQKAKKLGIDENFATQIIQAQIDAAKQVQSYYFSKWESLGIKSFDDVLDLNTELRPKIDAATNVLVMQLLSIQNLKNIFPLQTIVLEEISGRQAYPREIYETAYLPLIN